MKLPARMEPYEIKGLTLKPLGFEHKAMMMEMQDRVLGGLPNPQWYFPSEEWEFDQWLENGDAVGCFDGEKLAGYAVLTAWQIRGDHAYALCVEETPEDTFDFHDVMVETAYRGKGIHTRFLKLFTDMAREAGGKAIYATVDPENSASWHNFEKAGYRVVRIQPAYDSLNYASSAKYLIVRTIWLV